jgi:hypothetical protein
MTTNGQTENGGVACMIIMELNLIGECKAISSNNFDRPFKHRRLFLMYDAIK